MRRRKFELTRGEEEVMHHIWNLKEATVGDVISQMAEPKPKYTTVATFFKLLERKNFIDHYQMGKSFVYIPIIKKEAYAKIVTENVVGEYFDGSISKLISFYVEHEDIPSEELEKIISTLDGLKR